MFYILAAVSIGGGVCFAVLGSGETQSFNEDSDEDGHTSTYRKIEEGEEEETAKLPVNKN